jgi:hypothetical protein
LQGCLVVHEAEKQNKNLFKINFDFLPAQNPGLGIDRVWKKPGLSV